MKSDIDLKLINFQPTEISFPAKLNALARNSDGEVFVFLDGNLTPTCENWLSELVGFALQEKIGAVGAKLLDETGAIKHGGIILGVNSLLGKAHEKMPKEICGNFMRAKVINNFSAVSGECIAIRRELFEEVKGFDEANFPNLFFDIDLCLRLQDKGYRIVFTPYAELLQTEDSMTEKKMKDWRRRKKIKDEIDRFQNKWRRQLENDPHFNQNLSLNNGTSNPEKLFEE